MLLAVRRKDNNSIHRVIIFKDSDEKITVRCKDWPGEHDLTECDLLRLTPQQETVLKYFFVHGTANLKKISSATGISYQRVSCIVSELNIPYKEKKIAVSGGKFFNPNISAF